MTGSLSPFIGLPGGAAAQIAEAKALFSSADATQRGSLSPADFRKIYLELGGSQSAEASTFPIAPESWTIAPETWSIQPTSASANTLPSFVANYPLSQVRAAAAFDAFDINHSGTLSTREFVDGLTGMIAPNTPLPDLVSGPTTAASVIATAQNTAKSMLSQYDTAGKGYITESDLVTSWTVNPSLGSVTNAPSIFASFDANGDGKLTQDELTNSSLVADIVHKVQTQLDPTKSGTIAVANLPALLSSSLIFDQKTIAGWDSNHDGTITSAELVAGLHQAAQNFIATYDSAAKGSFTAADVTSYLHDNPTATTTHTPAELVGLWDVNGDGSVSMTDILGGLDASLTNQLTNQSTDSMSAPTAATYETALSLFNAANVSASSILATYDIAGKGYISSADIAAMWATNPSLGDPGQASHAIAQWDLSGDGKVTRDEIAAGQLITSIATKITGVLDPLTTGQIAVSSLTDARVAGLSFSAATIASWDSHGKGTLTSDDILAGVKSSLAATIANYASSNTTSVTNSSIAQAITINPALSNGVAASAIMNHWDINGDGVVTEGEIAATKLAELNANFAKASTTPTSTTPGAVLRAAQQNAISMLSVYDGSGQGSINAADLASAFSKNPNLAGGQTASDVMALFDLNGDGVIDPQELVAGNELQSLVDKVFQRLDPNGTGRFSTSSLAAADGTGLPFTLSTLAKWDLNQDGSVTQTEAIKAIYTEVTQTIGQFDTSGKGYFDQSDIQTFIDANPAQYGAYSASSILAQWDVNGDGQVSPSDILATMVSNAVNAAAIPTTIERVYAKAKDTADATMELFDTKGQGTVTQESIATATLFDPTLGLPSDAATTLSAWDMNGDGKVTESELIADSIGKDLSNTLLTQLDPTGSGSVAVSSLQGSTISAPYLANPATTIATWDANSDGSVSQAEIIKGLTAEAGTFIARFDMTNKGYFTQADVQAVIDMNPSVTNMTASGMMKQWDANGDGKIDTADVLSGFSMGQSGSAVTWSSDTAPSADQVLAAMGLNTSASVTPSA
jgi:Ca2+-binding EF-hand superfamily protein